MGSAVNNAIRDFGGLGSGGSSLVWIVVGRPSKEQRPDEGAKKPEPGQEEADVVAGGDEQDVDGVVVLALEPAAFKFPSSFMWPMIGSMALRRRSSRSMVGAAMPRVWEM